MNLGTQGWIDQLLAHIKRTWIKQDLNPLTVKADWSSLLKQQPIIQNNSVVASLSPDHGSGAISAEDYQAFWEASMETTGGRGDASGASASVAAATIQQKQDAGRRASGAVRVQKPAPKPMMKRPMRADLPTSKPA